MATRDELSRCPEPAGRDSGTASTEAGQSAGQNAGRLRAPSLKELATQVLARAGERDRPRDTVRDSASVRRPAVAGNSGQSEDLRWRHDFEERAAIREHDGGMSRADAEAAALLDCAALWRSRNPLPPTGPNDPCCHCDLPMTVEDRTPVLAAGGHAWLHRHCWAPMNEARQQEALVAVRAKLAGKQ